MNETEQYAVYECKFGKLKIRYLKQRVLSIKIILEKDEVDDSICTPFTNKVFLNLQEYFDGKRKSFDFKYELEGTVFQKKVWQALCEIPYGETKTYKDIAIAIGKPRACRAVGMANNKNPIIIVVPCHRVIGTSGKLVGYAGGLEMKAKLLEIEKKNKS